MTTQVVSCCMCGPSGGNQFLQAANTDDGYVEQVDANGLGIGDTLAGLTINSHTSSYAAGSAVWIVRNAQTGFIKWIGLGTLATEESTEMIEVPFVVERDDQLLCQSRVAAT